MPRLNSASSRAVFLLVGTATAFFGQHSTTPVLLVNGFQVTCPSSGEGGTFGQLSELLTQDAGSATFHVDFFDVCSDAGVPIEDLAALLATKIQAYPGPVDVIAHSMGGLLVRAYLQGRTGGPYLNPPLNPNIRKLIFLGTPHAGVANIDALWPSAQVAEMQFGSTFLWSLNTWNQLSDDLRGIDALAIAGTAGVAADGVPWDGVVDVSSASLDFDSSVLPNETVSHANYTVGVPYCHTSDMRFLCDAGALDIAYITNRSHLSYQLIRSFLDGTNTWTTIAPPAYSLVSTGGMTFTLSDSNGVPYNQLSSVNLVANGASYALSDYPSGWIWSSNDLPAGRGSVTIDLAGQGFSCPTSIAAGGFATLPCKFGPVIDIGGVFPSAGVPVGARSVAADSFISVYGATLASSTAQAPSFPLPYKLADASVAIDGFLLGLDYVSAQQINALLPSGLTPGLHSLVLMNSTGQAAINLMIENAVPTLFYYGNYAASAEDAITGQLISSTNPATAGEYVALYGTGLGPTFSSGGLNVAVTTPSVYVGGLAAKVIFAGRAPGYTGLDQIDIQIPSGLQTGNVAIVETSGSRMSNTVYLAVH
jgi:uncharacterized protein (TIGR03437 family)